MTTEQASETETPIEVPGASSINFANRLPLSWLVHHSRLVSFVARSLLLGLTIAVFYALLKANVGRRIDLVSFSLVIASIAIAVIIAIQLQHLYGTIQPSRFHLPSAHGKHPLDWILQLPGLAIWADKLVRLLVGAALCANLAVFAYVSAKYTALPPFLPLHYSASGEVDRLGTAGEVYMMPAIGAVVLLANLVCAALAYQRERLAAYIISAASIFVQVVVLIATANIVSRA